MNKFRLPPRRRVVSPLAPAVFCLLGSGRASRRVCVSGPERVHHHNVVPTGEEGEGGEGDEAMKDLNIVKENHAVFSNLEGERTLVVPLI